MMPPDNAVEFADRKARLRPLFTALLALYFIGSQAFTYPHFGPIERHAFGVGWTIQVAVMLLLLLPIVGFGWGRRVRELINDDVVQLHLRTALARGFWIAMLLALALFLLPASAAWTGRQALYFVVTPTLPATMLIFAWLDSRAYRDG
jgi:hypothetical protein